MWLFQNSAESSEHYVSQLITAEGPGVQGSLHCAETASGDLFNLMSCPHLTTVLPH